MADVSLDDYIQKKKFTVQIRNVGNTNRTGKKSNIVKGRVKFTKTSPVRAKRVSFTSPKHIRLQKQKNGQVSLQTNKNKVISLQTRKNKGLQDKSNVRPLSVTVANKNLSGFSKGVFDARDKITAAKRPVDARDKLAAKAKLTDARSKIQNKQNENNSNKVIVTGLGKTLKTINTEIKSTPNITRTLTNQSKPQTGVQISGNSMTITRNVSNNTVSAQCELNQGNPQTGVQMSGNSMKITRNINNTGFGISSPQSQLNLQTGTQMSGNSMKITRNINNTGFGIPSTQSQLNLQTGAQMTGNSMKITRNINNTGFGIPSTQSQNIRMTNNRGPVIQVANDQYETPEVPPLKGYYEYDEPSGYHYSQPEPMSHITEKTLTVKYPQYLQQNPIPVITSKPPVKPAPLIAVKRKAPTSAPIKLSTSGPLKLAGGPLKLAKPTMVADTVVAKKPKLFKQEVNMEAVEDSYQEQAAVPTLNSPLQGYKIAITNLHPVVSQDDIIELFGAVGAMKRARLLKEGTAEVVYVQKEDAAKAIQKYHNRELDGIPMQVKLATPQPLAPVTKKVVSSMPTEETLPPNTKAEPLKLFKGATKNVPESDIETGTLHRALFKTGASQQSKLVTFTVKI